MSIDKIRNIGLDKLVTQIYDFDSLTTDELMCKFAQKINIIIEHLKYIDDRCYNSDKALELKLQYLLNEGLEEQVAKRLIELINNGTMGNLVNDTLLKEINEKVDENSNYTKRILKAENNSPTLLNTTLDEITNNANSVIDFNSFNGVVELEAGIYEVDTVIMRSNITIKGQGIGKTIIKPIFSNINKYIFDVDGTDSNNRLVNFELMDLSIMSSPNYQYAIEEESARYLASVINFSYCSSCRLTNVAISGFKGIAINQIENYDCNLDNVQILGCGDSKHNSITFLNGTTDGCNAIHIDGLRVEQCSGIKIECNDAKFQREIQFSISKIEGTPIIFSGSSNINIVGCHFTWDSTQPLLNFLNNTTTEAYGIKFSGCSFLSNNGKLYNNDGNVYPQFICCNFKGFNDTFNSSKINVQCCEFYSCLAPIVTLDSNNTFSNNKLIATRGDDYIIKINGVENYVMCNENISPITSKGGYVSNSYNQIINNYMVFNGVDNWLNSNNYQQVNGIRVTHNPPTIMGSLKYDVNDKFLYHYNGTTWNKIPSYQCESVPLCSTDTPSDIKLILNDLITKLTQCGIIKS